MENKTIQEIANEMARECTRATEIHGPMRGLHEGYAVILEELDELWAEIKKKQPDKTQLRKETVQLGAMCLKIIHNVIDQMEE